MPVNLNETMAMGPDVGRQEGAIEKKWFKHVGELADGGAAVIILNRTVPGEPNNCLVVGAKFLPDVYHDSLMKSLESEGGQAEFELANYLARQTFPDGVNMLQLLHTENFIKKFKTSEVIVTYGPLKEGRMPLNKLNEQIARDMNIDVKDLAMKEVEDKEAPVKATKKKPSAKKTTKK